MGVLTAAILADDNPQKTVNGDMIKFTYDEYDNILSVSIQYTKVVIRTSAYSRSVMHAINLPLLRQIAAHEEENSGLLDSQFLLDEQLWEVIDDLDGTVIGLNTVMGSRRIFTEGEVRGYIKQFLE